MGFKWEETWLRLFRKTARQQAWSSALEGGEWKRKLRIEIYGDPGESAGWRTGCDRTWRQAASRGGKAKRAAGRREGENPGWKVRSQGPLGHGARVHAWTLSRGSLARKAGAYFSTTYRLTFGALGQKM